MHRRPFEQSLLLFTNLGLFLSLLALFLDFLLGHAELLHELHALQEVVGDAQGDKGCEEPNDEPGQHLADLEHRPSGGECGERGHRGEFAQDDGKADD